MYSNDQNNKCIVTGIFVFSRMPTRSLRVLAASLCGVRQHAQPRVDLIPVEVRTNHMAHIAGDILVARPAVHQARIVERQNVAGSRLESHRLPVDQLHELGLSPIPAVHLVGGAREPAVALRYTVIDATHRHAVAVQTNHRRPEARVKAKATVNAHVQPVHLDPGEPLIVLGPLAAQPFGDRQAVGQQIECTVRRVRLLDAVQQIDAGRVLVVRQIGVHLQRRRQVGHVVRVWLVAHVKLVAVVCGLYEGDAIGQLAADALVGDRSAADEGHAVHGQVLQPVVQCGIGAQNVVESKTAVRPLLANVRKSLGRPGLSRWPVAVSQIFVLLGGRELAGRKPGVLMNGAVSIGPADVQITGGIVELRMR